MREREREIPLKFNVYINMYKLYIYISIHLLNFREISVLSPIFLVLTTKEKAKKKITFLTSKLRIYLFWGAALSSKGLLISDMMERHAEQKLLLGGLQLRSSRECDLPQTGPAVLEMWASHQPPSHWPTGK